MTKKTTIVDKIKSFEDAQAATGRPAVPAFSDCPEDLREYFQAQYKLIVIAEAINEGWKADWCNDEQQKWIPWHYCSPGSSSFAFGGTFYDYSDAYAGCASRLCFETKAKAEYAGRQFLDLWNIVLTK